MAYRYRHGTEFDAVDHAVVAEMDRAAIRRNGIVTREDGGKWYWNPRHFAEAEHWNGPFASVAEARADGNAWLAWAERQEINA